MESGPQIRKIKSIQIEDRQWSMEQKHSYVSM